MEENSYKIKITPKAYEDLDEIYGYIANDLYNEEAADNLMEKIESNVMRLNNFPFSCSFVRDEILKNKGYRKLVVENYTVFHLINEDAKHIVVMRVLYRRRKYQDLI
ncbi:addiction module RelE/StbE family toxin [Virgibacillus natechei]|uniref:Addiction module RelE/StbE family toxin n=1 Tax=Virgibacillus natechei TaxID=1216297 RepID=A0ABS4IJQ4_9BACI|nr:type II toxin-antitoxin system RelE/ParE family toxin [Virgibacillus natechei]MBP1970805.1 addiction module RelE/StbE family toxin [Virgibacillus natechei]UZD12298.1 type II toxin-antitoxin system RelE/ParE family toxin [Virgibacillus natechei]